MYLHFDWGYLHRGMHTHITSWLTTITAMNSSLTVDDIPVASLGNREPEKFKLAELRFWLQCQGARGLSKLKTKG